MPDWWPMLSTVMTPPIFVVLLVVLWKLLRGVNAVYTVLVYTHERMNALSAMVEKLTGAEGGDAEDDVTDEISPAPTAAPPPADDHDRVLFLAAAADPEQLRQRILTLLQQRSGLRYADLAQELGISVDEVKTLCADLERAGKIGGRDAG